VLRDRQRAAHRNATPNFRVLFCASSRAVESCLRAHGPGLGPAMQCRCAVAAERLLSWHLTSATRTGYRPVESAANCGR